MVRTSLQIFINNTESLIIPGYSKLAGILFITELQRRLNTDHIPIICLSIHPGGVLTGKQTLIVSMTPSTIFSSRKRYNSDQLHPYGELLTLAR